MRDLNGKKENTFVRRYDALDEIPMYILGDDDYDETMLPLFELFVDGSSEGIFESLSDALDHDIRTEEIEYEPATGTIYYE